MPWDETIKIYKIFLGFETALPPVGGAKANPRVPDLLIMDHWVVDRGGQSQNLRRKSAHRGENVVGRHHPVVLRRDQCDAGIDQSLLRIEYVERGALTHPGLFAHAIESHLGRGDLGLGSDHLRFGGL